MPGCVIDFTNLNDMTYDCGLNFTGGLKTIKLMEKSEWDEAVEAASPEIEYAAAVAADPTATPPVVGSPAQFDFVAGVSAISLITAADVLTLGFNNKDGFSNFSDVKTVNADGSASAVPTVQVEFARMSAQLRNDLDTLATGGGEMVAIVETAAGTVHAIGTEFGLYAGTVDGATGAARTDKNRYQLTLTGEENSLSYGVSAALWTAIKAL